MFKGRRLGVLLAAALAAAGCRSDAPAAGPSVPAIIDWRPIASWSGHGNAQLDAFPIEQWGWRVQWETKNEAPAGRGAFHVEAHSADSGRLLDDLVDVQGPGHDTAYVTILPRRFYLVVESKNVDWSMTVEEPILSQ
jgi:hypothetical protein